MFSVIVGNFSLCRIFVGNAVAIVLLANIKTTLEVTGRMLIMWFIFHIFMNKLRLTGYDTWADFSTLEVVVCLSCICIVTV
jgi:hypothetical protein